MEKPQTKDLKEKLFKKSKNGWEDLNKEEKDKIFAFCDKYIKFINEAKTERECVLKIVEQLKEKGFKNIEETENLKAGDKIYYINRNKNIYAAVIGKEDLEKGFNIIGAHIDSPRLDLKPNPLYESSELAMLKTHYYGGIKKYQWVNIPLSMHGVIIKENNEKININIGENDDDPIFTIADLLPHLSSNQNKKKLEEAKVLVAHNSKIILACLKKILEKYNITVVEVMTPEEVYKNIEKGDFDLVITDEFVGKVTAKELCLKIRFDLNSEIKIIKIISSSNVIDEGDFKGTPYNGHINEDLNESEIINEIKRLLNEKMF